jgi:hypothetical protein
MGQRKNDKKFNKFRNSLFDQLRPIDIRRNEVVHWNVVYDIGLNDNGKTTARLVLMPPNFWIHDSNTPQLTKDQLVYFMAKCDFYCRLIDMFLVITGL